ncbi:hypothetical protein TNCV_2342661 [Trichonephila clavipes]|nr:hypothetical protein TNCV_2342661 [Trichonephila clavipes]
MTLELASSSPTTPGQREEFELDSFNVHQSPLHGVSLFLAFVVPGLEPGYKNERMKPYVFILIVNLTGLFSFCPRHLTEVENYEVCRQTRVSAT